MLTKSINLFGAFSYKNFTYKNKEVVEINDSIKMLLRNLSLDTLMIYI